MALEGTLSYLDISHLLQVVGSSLKSGVLEISWEDRWARLFFERGDLIRAESNRSYDSIGTLLLKAHLVDPKELDRALAIQIRELRGQIAQPGQQGGARRLGAILCDEGGVRPQDIERILRTQFEQIVFDVFSWPGGSFVFSFQEPSTRGDRFRVDAVDFILGVGIQAGLLAEEGVAQERADPRQPHLVFLEEDPELLVRYQKYWRGKGHRVTGFNRVEEVLAWLGGCTAERGQPVVIANLVCPSSRDRGVLGGLEVLETASAAASPIPTVLLGTTSDPKARDMALAAGSRAFVRKPKTEDLRGSQAEVCFETFMAALGHALESALPGEPSRASDPEP